jgi:hypothetical protein
MRMFSVVTGTCRLALVRAQMQQPALEKPEGPVISLAESPAGLGYFVEHGLEPSRAGDSAQDAADRALLLPHILELAGQLRAVGRNVSHTGSLGVPMVTATVAKKWPLVTYLGWMPPSSEITWFVR